jgi:hypothetical protein
VPYGNGAIEVAKNKTLIDGTLLLDAIAYADPTTPANDVASLIRVYRPGETDEQAPIHEWLIEDPVAESDDAGTVRLSGGNIEHILDYEHVEVWDWDASATFISRFPDHVYGGRNLIRNGDLEEPQHQNEIVELWNDQVAASTFTLTLESATTAAIAFDATPAQVETAIEATAGVTDCRVTGAGTEADPWRIEFDTPFIIDPNMTVTDSGGLTSTIVNTQHGKYTTEPFTISQTVAAGVNWLHGALEPDHPFISTAIVRNGTYSIGFNATEQYGGIQTIINVTPGGTYQASMWARTADTAALWRLIIRTPTEEFVASTTPFAGTALAANTWTEFAISDIAIPDGVTQIVMRFAYVGTGNPGVVYTDDWSFNEGLAAASAGSILTDLYDDAQTDHSPTRAALTFINLDFDGANDSGGSLWPTSSLSITIKRGETYLQMMRQFEKLGYEWKLTPTAATPGEWDLQVYGPGGLGTDHTGADDPAIVIGQGTLPSTVTRQKPAANYLMAEGYGGITTRTGNTDSIGAVGRRTAAVKDTRFTDGYALTEWAVTRLENYLAAVVAPRIVLTEPNAADDWPRPLDEYAPGDTIDYVLIGTSVSRRIERINYNHTTDDLVWTVEGGTASPFIGPAPTAESGGGIAGHQQLNVLGTAVRAILEEFRFSDDTAPVDQPLLSGVGNLPAFTVRVAASDARAESKAAADFLCSGSNDQQIIDLAFAICTGLGFGDVVLSEGTFYIDTTWTTGSVGRLRGLGIDQTTLLMEAVTVTLNVDHADLSLVEVDPCGT